MNKRILSLVIFLIMVFFLPSKSNCLEMEGKKVIMVLINHISIYDIDESTPNLKHMIDSGAIALMNTRTSGSQSNYKAYVTLGSGTRAEGNFSTANGYQINTETAGVYIRRTGIMPSKDSVVNLEINRLKDLNKAGDFGAIPGALGQIVNNKGLKTAVIGSCDTLEDKSRPAVTIAMNNSGQVDYGYIEGILTEDSTKPHGISTDFDAVYGNYLKVKDQASLVVIDTGDITRIEGYRANLSREMYSVHKESALVTIDAFVGKLMENMNKQNTRLYVVTPYPGQYQADLGNRLTPLLVYGNGVEQGYLTSSTTKRRGIVANIDVPASIAQYLTGDTAAMIGSTLEVIPYGEDTLMKLKTVNGEIVNVSINRWPVLSSFSIYQIILLIFSVLCIVLRKYVSIVALKSIDTLILTTMVAPLVLLLLGFVPSLSFYYQVLLLVALSLAAAYVIKLSSKNRMVWIAAASLVTVFAISIDILFGSRLIKFSLLGYDPIIGARYYGVGNEFVGILIGAVIVGYCALIDINNSFRKLYPALCIFMVVVLGFPALGANVGGTITASASLIYLYFKLNQSKIGIKKLMTIAFSVVLVVTVMAVVDIFVFDSSTHLSKAVLGVVSNGPASILQTIFRKFSMNIRLVRVTLWSWVLLSIIVTMAVVFRRPKGLLLHIFNKNPNLSHGWIAVTIACIVGFIFNDSGVVLAATSSIYLITSLLLLVFDGLSKDRHIDEKIKM